MSDQSDGTSDTENCNNTNWTIVDQQRRKRKKKDTSNTNLAREELHGFSNMEIEFSQHRATTDTYRTPSDKPTQNLQQKKQTLSEENQHIQKRISNNYSPKMKEITFKEYKNMFYITPNNLNRFQMSDIWDEIYKNSKDVILQTQRGLLLKTDTEKNEIKSTLNNLIKEKTIISYKETSASQRPSERKIPQPTYCAVIASVEQEIQDTQISEFLNKIKINHRFCKRIIAKAIFLYKSDKWR